MLAKNNGLSLFYYHNTRELRCFRRRLPQGSYFNMASTWHSKDLTKNQPSTADQVSKMIFCSTENVINSFHLGVISTIHLWRYTFGCTTLEKLCFQGTGCGLWPWLLQSFLDFGRSCLQCSFRSPPSSCSVELHSRQSLCHLWNNLKLSLNGRRTVLRVPCVENPIWGQQSCENWTLQVPFLAFSSNHPKCDTAKEFLRNS